MLQPIIISTGSRQLVRETQPGAHADLVDEVVPGLPDVPTAPTSTVVTARLDADGHLPTDLRSVRAVTDR